MSMVLQEWLYKLSQWTLHHLLQNQVERRTPWTHLAVGRLSGGSSDTMTDVGAEGEEGDAGGFL
jgi:hypothetical protein